MNDETVDVLAALEADEYHIGNLQALPYDRRRPDLFPDNLLYTLYARAKSAHTLRTLFCGMSDLSSDAICSYLASKPVLLLVQWDDPREQFQIAGFAFIVTWVGVPPPAPEPRSAFAAYMFFPEWYGNPDAQTLAMLGMARWFKSYKLTSLFGTRYASNGLTARFMGQFGFRDIATLPGFLIDMQPNGKVEMADGIVSRLTREDFISYVEKRLIAMLSGE